MTAENIAALIPAFLLFLPAVFNFARWRILERRGRAPVRLPEVEAESSSPPTPFPSRPTGIRQAAHALRMWTGRHPLETSLAAVLVGLAIYVWLASPPIHTDAMLRPRTPGTPYNALHFVRDFELKLADDLPYPIAVVGALASLGCLAASIKRRSSLAARVGMLIPSLGLLALWQLANQSLYKVASPLPVLVMGILSAVVWVLAYQPHVQVDLSPHAAAAIQVEVFLIVIAFLPTVLARTIRLSSVPYGIEGDELKWTVEVVQTMVDGRFAEAAEYHLASLPVSFYMEAPFHRLMGPGVLSARLAAVAYSLLGSLAVYGLARVLFGWRVAWLTTFLLGISLLDTSASRLANVESLTKLWPPLSLLLLALAIDRRRLALFLAAGVAVTLGLLTYDTVAPLLAVGVLLLVFELVRRKTPVAESVRHLISYLGPQLLALPVVATYLGGRLQYYRLGDRGLQDALGMRLVEHAGNLIHGLFVQTPRDFLFNRNGPLLEAPLVPWLLLGLILALANLRRGRLAWPLVYAAVFFLPMPIVGNVPMGRVLYPGLPAVYLLMAIAMICAYREVDRLLGDAWRPALLTLITVGLVDLAMLNQYIYFHEVSDPDDRRIRRELYEIARQSARSGTAAVFPFIGSRAEPIEAERKYAIWLGLRSGSAQPLAADDVGALEAEALLPHLSSLAPPEGGLVVAWDRVTEQTRQERETLLATLLECYPDAIQRAGVFFDEIHLSQSDVISPSCGSGKLSLSAPADQASLRWTWEGAPITTILLSCGAESPDTQTIQAEWLKGPGWTSETRFADEYKGEGFLIDNMRSGPATYAVSLSSPGEYFVWIRSLRRVVDEFPASLTLGDHQGVVSGDSVALGEWVWERIGPFEVAGPSAQLTLTRPYTGELSGFMALFFDEIIITSDAGFDPRSDSTMMTVLEQRIRLTPGQQDGWTTPDLEPGRYMCWISASDGMRIVDSYGNVGVRSEPVEVVAE